MVAKSLLIVTLQDDIDQLFDEGFRKVYQPLVLTPSRQPDIPGPEAPILLIVITGYSLQELYRHIPEAENLVSRLPSRLPRLYLLQETDPSLSLVPLKGDQRFFYLRGPISTRTMRSAVDQILAMKPRPVRFPLSPEQGINARFSIRPRRQAPANAFHKTIQEISPTGFSFHWDTSAPLLYPGDMLEDLELRAHESPFLYAAARVKHLTPLRSERGIEALRVGVEFVDPPAAGAEPMEARAGAFLDDPLVIRTVLEDAVERHTEVVVRGESQSWEIVGTMTAFNVERQQLQVKIEPPGIPEEINKLDILSCLFVRDNAQLQFSSVLLEVNSADSTLLFRFPKRLDKRWARATLRYTFDAESAPRVEVQNPITPNSAMVREVMNLSPNGLCFWAEAQHDLLFKGMRLNRVSLVLPGGQRIHASAVVRYIGPRNQTPTPARIPCGIQFQGVSPADHLTLVTYLIAKNFPHVSDAVPSDEESLWRFLERADFYTPSKQADCIGDPLEVRDTQARMLNASPGFSRKLVFRDGGIIYGTVSLQQIYSQTWLVHHLCATRHRTEYVPRSLLLFLGEYISKTPEIEYIKMMWRPNNTWSNKMFGRLVHRLHDGEQSVVKVYQYLHRGEGPLPLPTPEEASWSIRPIRADEVVELESYFINQEEFFLMRSEDLIRGEVQLDGLDARYRALGLFRERRVFAAFEGGRLAGFVLAERSSPGLNLSNLLNTFQVHIALSEAPRIPALKRALIRHACQYYLQHNQWRMVALTEDADLSAWEAMGFTKHKEYVSWTFDHNIANIYNLYCYYIFRLYERLEAQRRARQERIRP